MPKRFAQMPAATAPDGRLRGSVLSIGAAGELGRRAFPVELAPRKAPARRQGLEDRPRASLSAVELLEVRILEAGRTLRRLPPPGELRGLAGYRCPLGRIQASSSAAPPVIDPAAIDDLDRVLALLAQLGQAERLLVEIRMTGAGWRRIARDHYPGSSHERLRSWFRRILEGLVVAKENGNRN